MFAVLTLWLNLAVVAPTNTPPDQCKQVVDGASAIVTGAIELLSAEVRKRESASQQAGHDALVKYLSKQRTVVAALRQKAAAFQLDEKAEKRCETYTYNQFVKVLNKAKSVAGFYYNRQDTLRLLGDLFL